MNAEQINKAHSFLNDPGSTRKQRGVALAILKRNEKAAKEAGQMKYDPLNDGIPDDDY